LTQLQPQPKRERDCECPDPERREQRLSSKVANVKTYRRRMSEYSLENLKRGK
jgi:hypothetical protein